MIETAEDVYMTTLVKTLEDVGAGRRKDPVDVRTFEKFYKFFTGRSVPEPIPDLTLKARVDWGRWVVDCPYCHGAMATFDTDPSFFFCRKCKNDGTYQPIRVEFPQERRDIEALLIERPKANQNWREGEGLKFLERENAERGV